MILTASEKDSFALDNVTERRRKKKKTEEVQEEEEEEEEEKEEVQEELKYKKKKKHLNNVNEVPNIGTYQHNNNP